MTAFVFMADMGLSAFAVMAAFWLSLDVLCFLIHADLKTTMRYTQVSIKALEKIEGPIDIIMRQQSETAIEAI